MGDIRTQPRSVSQTEQWEKCGHQYKLQRIDRVVPRPAAWSFQGTAFHSAAEKFEKEHREASEEEMVQIFSDQYSTMVNGAMSKEPDLSKWMTAMKKPAGQDIEDRYKLGQSQVREYVQWSKKNKPAIWVTPDGKQALELYFKVEIGGVQVRGYIDQLIDEPDETVRVRDLKTGSTKSKLQLQTYKIAVEKLYGVKVNLGDWYFGKTGALSPAKGVDLAGVSEMEVGDRYDSMDEGVKAGDFPPNPGFHCGFCDVSHACTFKR